MERTMMVAFIAALLLVSITAGCARQQPSVPKAEVPKYGGILNVTTEVDTRGFDDAFMAHVYCYTLPFTNDNLVTGDWSKGLAGGHGSGQYDWRIPTIARLDSKTGAIAEKWEIQGKEKFVFHLRKGVRWANKPPTNGRQVNVEDVVFSLQRHMAEKAYFKTAYPKHAASTKIYALDENTVVVECAPEHFAELAVLLIDYMAIFPKDAVQQFGDMKDWRNNIGTGPFLLKEYIAGSHALFERNPDFWEKDPVGPGKGNALPYLDAVKWLIIPDESTRLAAFRTGQLDILDCAWENAQEFLRDPRLQCAKFINDYAQPAIFMRTDKKDSPFADKRVRQALSLAIDHKKILQDFYGGEGVLVKWPMVPVKGYENAYVPLEKLPRAVQELYEYHPEKAKQLLAEAGYLNGFKASIITWNTPVYLDRLALVKDMWSKVGVELTIEPKDYATFAGLQVRRAYEDMIYGWYAGIGTYHRGVNFATPTQWNMSYIDDPVLNKAREEMLAAYPDEKRVDEIHKNMMPYLLEQAYVIPLPSGYTYRFWWPWVKNYSGESSVGYYSIYNFAKYVWIDQTLKQSILGR